jgi:hypothetical protein
MGKAGTEDTPRCRYDEGVRAELKRYIEQVIARQGDRRGVDWNPLWNELERVASAYDWSVGLLSIKPHSPKDTIAGLFECEKLINALLRKLNTPALFNWNFISDSSDPSCRSIKRESPKKFRNLIEGLTAAREKLRGDAAELQKFAAGHRLRAYAKDDCVAEFKTGVLVIAQGLFGEQVGRSDGPVITFLQLALQPVLGDATPNADALRAFARRHTRRPQEGVDTQPDS